MKTAILVVGAGPSGLVLPNLLAANSASRRAFGIDDGSPMVPSYPGLCLTLLDGSEVVMVGKGQTSSLKQ